MELIEIGGILYLVNVVLSIIFALIIIDKLYISKKYTKEKDFHLYNDLFSWEIFYIFIGIENLIRVISIFLITNNEVSNLLIRIRILIVFFPFWIKIIHLEKIMEKITYKRHYFGGLIPFFIVLMLIILNVPNFIVLLNFLTITLIPFLVLFIFLKNTGTNNKKTLKVVFGAIFIGLGGIFIPAIILGGNVGLTKIKDLISAISFIIGTLLIFYSFWKEIFT